MQFQLAFKFLSLVAAAHAFTVEEVSVPATDDERHQNIGTSVITTGGVSYQTSYNVLLRTGDVHVGANGNVTFGAVLDKLGNQVSAYPMDEAYVEMPLKDDGSANDASGPLLSQINDFTSLLVAPDAADTSFVMFSHFETPLPAQIYRINVDFSNDCMVEVDSFEATDWSAWGGLWEPCSGKVTAWNTHLGSEEHEPDARLMSSTYGEFMAAYQDGNPTALNILHFVRYYDTYAKDFTDAELAAAGGGMALLNRDFNPYKYGHLTELSLDDSGNTVTKKWYTNGRVSIENPEIMPDGKTIYVADDANYGILTRLVLDTAQDLSSGTLYAAKFNQTASQAADPSNPTPTENGGYFSIEWIELGSATHDEIYAMVWTDGLTFDDILVVEDPVDGACSEGFTFTTTGWGPKMEECIKVQPNMEKAAAFLETRRYAAMKGASAEMQSMEGMASVPGATAADGKFYFALSKISNGMSDGEGDIDVPENRCGCVYEFDMDATYALTNGRALVCGTPVDDDTVNTCSTDSIASPDNLFYTGTFGAADDHSLLIAEDTSNHQNDYLWHHDFNTDTMTRMLTSVYGSQVTGPAYYSDGLGCYLLMAVVPHPYKKSDRDQVNSESAYNEGLMGNVGYIGPIGMRAP